MTVVSIWLAIALLGIWCSLGVAMTALRLPGTWWIVMGALGYGWWAEWRGVGAWIMAGLVVLGVAAEVIEFLASVVTARKVGASRRAAIGGLVGAIVGMILLSIPIPLIGTVIGALMGCFVGAMIGELTKRRDVAQVAKVGLFSAIGFVLGAVSKMAIALAMSALLLTSVALSADLTADASPAPTAVKPSPTP